MVEKLTGGTRKGVAETRAGSGDLRCRNRSKTSKRANKQRVGRSSGRGGCFERGRSWWVVLHPTVGEPPPISDIRRRARVRSIFSDRFPLTAPEIPVGINNNSGCIGRKCSRSAVNYYSVSDCIEKSTLEAHNRKSILETHSMKSTLETRSLPGSHRSYRNSRKCWNSRK